MGKKSPSPPPAPDPMALAQAQGLANKEAVRESALVNQIGEVSPFGRLTYTGEIGTPERTRTVSLTPEQQGIFDTQQQIARQLTDFAQGQTGRVSEQLQQPFSLEGLPPAPQADDAARQRIESQLFARLEPQFARDEDALRTRLANQGVALGSEAYAAGVDDLTRARNDARLAVVEAGGQEMARQFGLGASARNQAINEAMLQRSYPLNELSALLQGSPAIQQPQFAPQAQYQMAPPDIIGAQGLATQAGVQNYQAQQARAASDRAALANLLGMGAMGYFGFGRGK